MLFISCYTGVPSMGTSSPYNPGSPKGTTYYNSTGEPGVQTYFHDGGVTRCITTSSTVTCY